MFGTGALSAGLGAGMEKRWAERHVLGKEASSWTPDCSPLSDHVCGPAKGGGVVRPPAQPWFRYKRLVGAFSS